MASVVSNDMRAGPPEGLPRVTPEIDTVEARAAPRFTLLIRAACLVSPQGEFVCVIRDVSETGISVRLFHDVPTGKDIELLMPGGHSYPVTLVWARQREAGYEFKTRVAVEQIIHEAGEYPKRGMRLGLHFPVTLNTLAGKYEAIIENVSQQGAGFTCDHPLLVDQALRISAEGALDETRAKVRWKRGEQYGVVFDDTLSLEEFARFAARVQQPSLLD